MYVDRDFVYTSVPEELVGHKYVMSAMGDAGSDARHQVLLTLLALLVQKYKY